MEGHDIHLKSEWDEFFESEGGGKCPVPVTN